MILGAISLDLFAVLLGGATAMLPVFAKDILMVGPTGLGILQAAPALGALGTTIWLAHYPLQRRVGHILLLSVTVFGLATILFALSTSFWLSLLALVIIGASDCVSVVIRQSLVQLETPDEMREESAPSIPFSSVRRISLGVRIGRDRRLVRHGPLGGPGWYRDSLRGHAMGMVLSIP